MHKLKSRVQDALKSAGIYHRLKASPLYGLYWSIVDRSILERTGREERFYRNLLCGLDRGHMIFDVGTNDGTKTGIFLRLGSQVVAVDPDPTNQDILKEKSLKYRLFPKRVIVVAKALSDVEASGALKWKRMQERSPVETNLDTLGCGRESKWKSRVQAFVAQPV